MYGVHRGQSDGNQLTQTRTVALVTQDDGVRSCAARAFDAAPANWRLEFHEAPPPGCDHVVFGADSAPDLEPRFDPLRPATLLPELPPRSQSRAVGVVAACGGAGVTTVALHLAASLGNGAGTLLVEPPGRRSLSVRLGVPEEAAVWQPGESAEVSVPVAGGCRLLRTADLVAALRSLEEAGRPAAVDLDIPLETTRDVVAKGLLGAVVVVVPPSRPAARLTRPLLQQLGDLDRVVVSNRTGHGGEMTRDKLSAVIGAPVALELPCSPALRAAEDSGLLVQQPWNRWWRLMRRLALSLEASWTR